MAINLQTALGASLPEVRSAWDAREVILYHLGLGAGDPPTDPRELAWTFEDGLKVLPSFATVQALPILYALPGVPGLDHDHRKVLHGEQELRVHAPLPAEGRTVTTGRIAEVYDKGAAALTVVEAETRTEEGELLATNRYSIFMPGAGGFGGERGPSAKSPAPEGEPDAELIRPVLPQLALLYRLTGDWNPLHADPEAARYAGFEQPILHGLATYGIVLRAIVDELLGGDVTAVGTYRARFSGVVYPGETLVVRVWRGAGELVVEAATAERGEPVLAAGVTRAT